MGIKRDLPKKLNSAEIERKFMAQWAEECVYQYDPTRSREETFSIDTPPPTVSGSLHIGHVFSYTHTDLSARFQRMQGKNIFYPMGWDDNGLATERRVQNLLNIRCDPSLSYDPAFVPDPKAKRPSSVSRRNFIELCGQVTSEDEKVFKELWIRLGLSVDWEQTYTTIDNYCRRISQIGFLDLMHKGEVYSSYAPSMWDLDFRCAVAQAEVEDREIQGMQFHLRFGLEKGGTLPIMTTRPELLAACVGVVVHPDDKRYSHILGTKAITPAFGAMVPIHAHELADPDKGTGAVMVCTYGDVADVEWQKDLQLHTRVMIGQEGRMLPVDWGSTDWPSINPEKAKHAYAQIVGKTPKQAKALMAEVLADPVNAVDGTDNAPLEGDPIPITQQVRFYEKGKQPLEMIPTRQWFVRLLDKKTAMIEQGRKIDWHPEYMRQRYEHWVKGLKYDWCVSRQRYFGVPIPVWHKLDANGEPIYDEPLLPSPDQLPIDPMTDRPSGFHESERDQPNGFSGDADIFDTWITSSLTPQITSGFATDETKFSRTYPMDIRPQAHELIRTWAFYTIFRAHALNDTIPWKNVVISGWVLDPDRKKMSKSKGNAVTPMGLIEQYGSDSMRYWSARARLGTDTAWDDSIPKIGRKLVTKIFNAGKLIVGRIEEAGYPNLSLADVTNPLDQSFLATLGPVITEASNSFQNYETAAALDSAETWFWSHLTDNQLELTKERAYEKDRSAIATWSLAMSTILRLFAPFLPFITDEVWSWYWRDNDILNQNDRGASIHKASWPTVEQCFPPGAKRDVFDLSVDILSHIRRVKSEQNRSIKYQTNLLTLHGNPVTLIKAKTAIGDILAAGNVTKAKFIENPKDSDSHLSIQLTDA